MSKVIPGIQGIPFRKVVSRVLTGKYPVEKLSCGHEHVVYDGQQYHATKRRCYHRDCRIK